MPAPFKARNGEKAGNADLSSGTPRSEIIFTASRYFHLDNTRIFAMGGAANEC
jgi:hypothetical protein